MVTPPRVASDVSWPPAMEISGEYFPGMVGVYSIRYLFHVGVAMEEVRGMHGRRKVERFPARSE